MHVSCMYKYIHTSIYTYIFIYIQNYVRNSFSIKEEAEWLAIDALFVAVGIHDFGKFGLLLDFELNIIVGRCKQQPWYIRVHIQSGGRGACVRDITAQRVSADKHTHTHTHMHIWFQSSMKTIQYFMRTTWFAPFQQLQTTTRVQGQQTGANPPQLQHVLQLQYLSKCLILTPTQAHTHTYTNTNTHMRAHTLTNT